MKHIFIINPQAGKFSAEQTVREALAAHPEYDTEVYLTEHSGDATRYIKDYCREHPDLDVRFYACGGDGTINEVAEGVYQCPRASMSCYPCGSGNDYVKYFGGRERFLSVADLLCAEEQRVDLMKIGDRVAVNVANFGFDSCVAKTMHRVRRKKIIGGKNAYTTGIVVALCKAMRTRCTVYADGQPINPKGKLLLCTVSNGKYVGGSFCCAPYSDNADGLLELCLVRPVSRLTFIRLVRTYAKGEHLGNSKFAKFISYLRCKEVVIDSPDPEFSLCIDGEMKDATHFEISVLPSALRFAIPGAEATVSETDEASDLQPV